MIEWRTVVIKIASRQPMIQHHCNTHWTTSTPRYNNNHSCSQLLLQMCHNDTVNSWGQDSQPTSTVMTSYTVDGKLWQEYSYQKLSESDNWFSSYSRKCRGCFLGHRVKTIQLLPKLQTGLKWQNSCC